MFVSCSGAGALSAGGVFVVGEVVAPHGVAFGDGDVGHEVGGGAAVPVLLAAGDADDVAGTDGDERSAAGLDVADAFGDVQGLADGVVVPGGVRARCEVHAGDAHRCRALTLGDRVDVDVAGEPVGRAFAGGAGGDVFHQSSSGRGAALGPKTSLATVMAAIALGQPA